MGVKRDSERPGPDERGVEHTLYDVIRHIRPLHMYFARSVEKSLVGTGVSMPLRAVMERLYEHGPQTVPQVARSLFLGRQFIQRLVNAGLEGGLLETRTNPAHRRSSLIGLTARGRTAIAGIKGREESLLRDVAGALPRKDIEAALRVMELLAERFRPDADEESDNER